MSAASPQPPKSKSSGMSKGMMIAIGLGCACIGGVGVIGVLAAIAVPNFLTFQCKSKQAEAKTNLSGLFTAEKAFYGEYDTYSSDLLAVNWGPDEAPRYVYGFAHQGPGLSRAEAATQLAVQDYDESRSDTTNSAVVAKFGYRTNQMNDLAGNPLTGAQLPEETFVEKDRFLAGAIGDISPDDQGALDTWTIDETKSLTNLRNDCSR